MYTGIQILIYLYIPILIFKANFYSISTHLFTSVLDSDTGKHVGLATFIFDFKSIHKECDGIENGLARDNLTGYVHTCYICKQKVLIMLYQPKICGLWFITNSI